jgi:hypothetical protein
MVEEKARTEGARGLSELLDRRPELLDRRPELLDRRPELLDRRPELTGVYLPADVTLEAVRWSA